MRLRIEPGVRHAIDDRRRRIVGDEMPRELGGHVPRRLAAHRQIAQHRLALAQAIVAIALA